MNEKQTSPEEMPDELADKLKAWRQAHPKATLTEIEEAVEAELAQKMKELVTALAHAGEESQEDAPLLLSAGRRWSRTAAENEN